MDVIHLLLERGADVNKVIDSVNLDSTPWRDFLVLFDRNGRHENHYKTAKAFILHGADVDATLCVERSSSYLFSRRGTANPHAVVIGVRKCLLRSSQNR